jgi:hypothetical protein
MKRGKTLNSFLVFKYRLMSTISNTTYNPTSFDKDEILANHRSFMTSLNIPSGKKSEDLPYLYWIPKLHKTEVGLYVVLLEVSLFMPNSLIRHSK